MLDAYKYIVYLRTKTTTEFLKAKQEEKKKAQKTLSCVSKCFSLLKTLIVYAVASCLVIPLIYEIYNKISGEEKSLGDDFKWDADSDGPMTKEDIRKRAEEEQARKDEAFRKKMEDMGVHEERDRRDDDDDDDGYEGYTRSGDSDVRVDNDSYRGG